MVATSGGGNNFAFILNCAFKDNAVYNVGNVDRSVLDLLEELLEGACLFVILLLFLVIGEKYS